MEDQDLETRSPESLESSVIEPVSASPAPVLVAVDFSRESEAALIWACRYAKKIGAPLEILHVIHDPADSPGTYRPENGDPFTPMTDVAQGKLTAFLDRVGQENPNLPSLQNARSICMPGLPVSTILQVAKVHAAQHLVLGRRRRNGLARILHGSTALQVAGHAPIRVTIVKMDG